MKFVFTDDSTWPDIATDYCAGSRQSPINIDKSAAAPDSSLSPFNFVNFNSKSSLKSIKNTGKTGVSALPSCEFYFQIIEPS